MLTRACRVLLKSWFPLLRTVRVRPRNRLCTCLLVLVSRWSALLDPRLVVVSPVVRFPRLFRDRVSVRDRWLCLVIIS